MPSFSFAIVNATLKGHTIEEKKMLKITGTFLDEITWDIPSQNWNADDWDNDFNAMKKIGIDTVIIIRAGLRNQCIFSSKVLDVEVREDLAKLFLEKAEKYDMKLYFGLYDSANFWMDGDWKSETDINLKFIDEVWQNYGNYKSFYGWYLAQEIGRNKSHYHIADIYNTLGEKCKNLTPEKPILISPYFYGKKIDKKNLLTPQQTQKQWDDLLSQFKYIDIVAYQDGPVPTHDLPEYWKIIHEPLQKHKITLWANVETFTRDMPIKFPPIDIRDLTAKLNAAEPYVEKAITFEFSHFMSPNSIYPSAGNLYRRYSELIKLTRGCPKNGIGGG